jgi:hypothetical protein
LLKRPKSVLLRQYSFPFRVRLSTLLYKTAAAFFTSLQQLRISRGERACEFMAQNYFPVWAPDLHFKRNSGAQQSYILAPAAAENGAATGTRNSRGVPRGVIINEAGKKWIANLSDHSESLDCN